MKTSIHLKRIVVATGFALAIMAGAPIASHHLGFNGYDMISQAHAEDDGGGKGKMGSSGKGSGSKQDKGTGDHGTGSDHGKKDTKVTGSFMGKGDEKRDPTATLPDYAGVKGGKAGAGGKPEGSGTKKGTLFGDTYVLIRNVTDGTAAPVNGSAVQAFYVDSTGKLVLLTGVSVPYDPVTGKLSTKATHTLPDGTVVTLVSSSVELSRLSVSRAPTKVADKSLAEVTSKLAATLTADIKYDATGRLVINGVTVDSPLENLALYQAILKSSGGSLTLPTKDGSVTLDLSKAAVFLGAAADKAGSVTLDTVMYLNPVLLGGTRSDPFPYTAFDYNLSKYNVDVWVGTQSGTTVTWTKTTLAAAAGVAASTTATGALDFALAADAARAVILFVHDAPLLSFSAP